jgi:hypothetical protein
VQDNTKKVHEVKAKRTAKNSVFIDLFRDKKNLLELYKTLHPEDNTATEDSLTDVTIENVLTDNLYNDLGFIVGDRLMILVEAQSTWTMNILVRVFLYLAQSYHEYFQRTNQNCYKSKKVKMPRPEIYVIFTGNRGRKPDKICLSEEFFGGADVDIEVKARVIYESNTDDIINQYIVFCKVFNEQTRKCGMTKKAVTETIRICKDSDVLREYLSNKEKEVVTIMMRLFDEEEILKSYIRSERYEAAQEAAQEATRRATQETTLRVAKKTAITMIKKGRLSVDEIPTFFPELTPDDIEDIKKEVVQLV